MTSVLLVASAMVILALAARHSEGSWLAPSVLFALLWSIYPVAVALYVADPYSLVPAQLWAASAAVAYALGGSLAAEIIRRATAGNSRTSPTKQLQWLGLAVLVCLLAGFTEIFIVFSRAGLSPRGLFNFATLTLLSASNRTQYQYGELDQGLIERLLVVVVYAGAFFGGLYWRLGSGWRGRVASVLTLLSVLVFSVLYGSRMGALFGGSAWIASWLAANALGRGDRYRAGRILVVTGGLTAAVLVGFSMIAQIVRYAFLEQRDIASMFADPFGYFATFAQWFSGDRLRVPGLSGGFYTFERLATQLSFSFPRMPAVDVGFTTSNIYTVHQALLSDWGMVGAWLILIVGGGISGCAFGRVVHGNMRWLAPLAVCYAWVLAGGGMSLFAYTAPTLGALAFLLYVSLLGRPPGILSQLSLSLGSAPPSDEP